VFYSHLGMKEHGEGAFVVCDPSGEGERREEGGQRLRGIQWYQEVG
jgi:hypothetical protein